MDNRKELLIIMPAYNEQENIGKVLDALTDTSITNIADILVVNDASTDGTSTIIAQYNNVRVLNNVYNMGYGSGLNTGYKYAMRHNYKFVIQMDADGQHDPCNIKTIYEALKKKDEDGKYPDIVLGSRFMKGGPEYRSSLLKRIAYALFRFLIRLGTGQYIFDPTTGLQGLSRKTFTFYAQYNHFEDMYPDANIIMQMLLLGFKVVEVPATMHFRTSGRSMHSGIKPIIYMFRMAYSILAVWVRIKIFRVDVGGR
ncbi:MAG: glycosyltransferase family 2 protein [Lachnospiraceae bacterium]|nr:glycosyltransferase family 2 protein [Lachnospiraceae bacterium]